MNRCTPIQQDIHLWILTQPLGLSYRRIRELSGIPLSTIQQLVKGKFPGPRTYYRLRELIIQCRDAYVLDDPRTPYLVAHKKAMLRLINDVLDLPRPASELRQSEAIRAYLTSLTEPTPVPRIVTYARKRGWPWRVVQNMSSRMPITKSRRRTSRHTTTLWQFTPVDDPPTRSV